MVRAMLKEVNPSSRLALMRVPRLNWNCSGVVPAILAHLEYPSRNSPKMVMNEESIPSADMPSITYNGSRQVIKTSKQTYL